MKTAYVFPGQGSQFVGMGAEYFDRFPEMIKTADSILGYSIKDLCLKDPNKQLNQTKYTQPALYTVNALVYAAMREDEHIEPDMVAGHSLGEYNALLCSGAYDFSTGLKLVKKRGELMAQVDQGGMIAVLGIDINVVYVVLREIKDNKVQIANINSSRQTILSGDKLALHNYSGLFEKKGAKVVPLNVSAAFHSGYMSQVKDEFSVFLREFNFNKLKIPVVANITGELYPSTHYESYLSDQITESVKWHDTIVKLMELGCENIREVGAGTVLTKLTNVIRSEIADKKISSTISISKPKDSSLLFMYGGQGFHYFRMGYELYETNHVFSKAIRDCDAIVQDVLGVSIEQEFYKKNSENVELENVLITHPAIYSFGYSLTKALEAHGIIPGAVMGYSLGEYVAATISGAISLKDALLLVCKQAKLLQEYAANGSMIAVLTDVKDFEIHPEDYIGATIACINYKDNFILSGEKTIIQCVHEKLSKRNVLSSILPVAHSFHSQHIEPIKNPFKMMLENVELKKNNIQMYSPAKKDGIGGLELEHFWNAIRNQVDFFGLTTLLKSANEYKFVDLSPTASLVSFLERGFGKSDNHHYVIDQFGNNNMTMKKFISCMTA